VISLTLFILLLCALGLCFASNRDIFSPAKFYHLSLAVYFVDIFLTEHNGYVYAVYFGVILAGMLMSLLEAYTLSKRSTALIGPKPFRIVPARFLIVLWALSVVPVLAQCYLIHITGGFASLAMTIAHRVVEWRGLGPLLFLIRLLAPINLIYFTIGLVYVKRHPFGWWFLYILHLILTIIVAVLMGGRSGILARFVLMMVVYNYLRRPVKLRYALVTGGALLVIAAFLGTVRANLTRLEGLDSVRHMQGDTLNLQMFSYSTKPLDLVFSREFNDYQHGKTFVAAVTNFVPRKIWPDKFDSARVVLTRFWLGRRYTGLTNMGTGIVVESIINFGYPMGLFCGFLSLCLIILAVSRGYSRCLSHMYGHRGLNRVYFVALYASLVQIGAVLLLADSAKIFGNAAVDVLFLSIVIFFLKLRLIPGRILTAEAEVVKSNDTVPFCN